MKINSTRYLTREEITDLVRYHKNSGYKRFHNMNLFIPYDTDSPSRYMVYSYYTCIGVVDNHAKIIYLDVDAYNHSSSTTRQIRRFIKEFSLGERIYEN